MPLLWATLDAVARVTRVRVGARIRPLPSEKPHATSTGLLLMQAAGLLPLQSVTVQLSRDFFVACGGGEAEAAGRPRGRRAPLRTMNASFIHRTANEAKNASSKWRQGVSLPCL